MANFYGATSLIGGGTGALDNLVDANGDPIGGDGLNDGDGAVVITSSGLFVYYLDATSGLSESSPDVIAPDVTPGAKRWILQSQAGESYKNIRSYGAVGDGVADDTAAFQAAITAAADNLLFLPAGTYLIAGDVTVPANVELWFANGAMLEVDSGDTVTIEGHIRDCVHQIFGGSGIVAGTPNVGFVRPEWWGAVADGVTDCADAIDKAIKFASDTTSKVQTVRFAAGDYVMGSGLSYGPTYDNVTLQGAGKTTYGYTRKGGTTIVAKNILSSTPLISLAGQASPLDTVTGWSVRDMQFIASYTEAANRCQCAFKLDLTSWVSFRSVDIRRFSLAGLWLVDSGGSSNWSHLYEDCYFGVSENGVVGACNLTAFVRCGFTACTNGMNMRLTNTVIEACDFEGNDIGIRSMGGANSVAVTIESAYFEAMGTANGIYGRFTESIIGSSRGGGTGLYLERGYMNIVTNWYGDITIDSISYNNFILLCRGTVTGAGVRGNEVLIEGAGAALAASWPLKVLKADGSVVATQLQAYLLSVVDDSGTPALGTTIVTNGTFDSDTAGWTAAASTLASVAGGQDGNCLEVTATGVAVGKSKQSIVTQPGARYKLSFYFKRGDSNGRVYLGSTEDGYDVYTSGTIYDASWTEYIVFFTAISDPTYITVLNLGGAARYCYFDSIAIQRVNEGNLAVGDHLSSNKLSVLGDVFMSGIKSGATQVAAGAAVGEVWWDTDDNTLKMGV